MAYYCSSARQDGDDAEAVEPETNLQEEAGLPPFVPCLPVPVHDAVFRYRGSQLPTADSVHIDGDVNPADELLNELQERIDNKDAGVKDAAVSNPEERLAKLLKTERIDQAINATNARNNQLVEDDYFVRLASAVGITLDQEVLNGCLLAECAPPSHSGLSTSPCVAACTFACSYVWNSLNLGLFIMSYVHVCWLYTP